MRSPDTTTGVAACLARITVLEAQRTADLAAGARMPEQVAIRRIAAQQHADALAFARRATP